MEIVLYPSTLRSLVQKSHLDEMPFQHKLQSRLSSLSYKTTLPKLDSLEKRSTASFPNLSCCLLNNRKGKNPSPYQTGTWDKRKGKKIKTGEFKFQILIKFFIDNVLLNPYKYFNCTSMNGIANGQGKSLESLQEGSAFYKLHDRRARNFLFCFISSNDSDKSTGKLWISGEISRSDRGQVDWLG